jgi:Cu/Ag efflux protein CusF
MNLVFVVKKEAFLHSLQEGFNLNLITIGQKNLSF